MDIEGPHKPIESVKDFFLHLFTITIGILIALTLEALVHDHHEKALVRESVVSLDAEVQANQAKLLKHRDSMNKLVDELNRLRNEVSARRGGAKPSQATLRLTSTRRSHFCLLPRGNRLRRRRP